MDKKRNYEEYLKIKEQIKRLQDAIEENEQKIAIIETLRRKNASTSIYRKASVSTMD